jgi:hypothetical protein
LVEKDGSRANGFFNEARIDGIETASWYARVRKNLVVQTRRFSAWERNIVPTSFPLSAHSLAIVWAIVDFPDPANPVSQ